LRKDQYKLKTYSGINNLCLAICNRAKLDNDKEFFNSLFFSLIANNVKVKPKKLTWIDKLERRLQYESLN